MGHFCITGVSIAILLSACGQSGGDTTSCKVKGNAFARLDVAEDSIRKTIQLYPTCIENATTANESECGTREKSLAYLEIAHKLISEVKENIPSCAKCHDRPMDCSEVLENGHNQSGVYTIWPRSRLVGRKPLDVYCDMETDGGGWTVLQRRGNFSQQQDFYQDWNGYKTGFGNITQDFWLGNDNIHALSNQGQSEIRFDLQDETGDEAYAVYKIFWIEDENNNYTLHIKDYSNGKAGDSMKVHDGIGFSTRDRGNITLATYNMGGWWYKSYLSTNLNGNYDPGKKGKSSSIVWWDWKKYDGLAASEMKVRPR